MKSSRLIFIISLLFSGTTFAQATPVVEVFKSPSCGCCGAWITHLRQNGFTVNSHDVDDVPAKRKQLGMPDKFGSCHSAKIGSYVIEGHVPASDIRLLLKQKPQVIGLAVPSMVPGSPGMEGAQARPYNTLLVKRDDSYSVFASH